MLAYLEKTPSIKVVVISSPFRQYLTSFDGKHHWRTLGLADGIFVVKEVGIETAVSAMAETIQRIRKMGKQVVLVAPPPAAGFNTGTCVERKDQGKWVVGAPTADCTIPLGDYRRFYARTLEFLQRVQNETAVTLISFDPILCDERSCASELDGTLIYVDGGHLTHEASSLLAGKIGLRSLLENAGAMRQ